MTILTKPFSEKKEDNSIAPLVLNEQLPPPNEPEDVEAQHRVPRILVFPTSAHRVSTGTTVCLLIAALTVVGLGIVGGLIVYDQYLSVSKNLPQTRFDWQETSVPSSRFEGWAQIPMNVDDDPDIKNLFKNFFQENFELDDDQKYEKIDVPNFADGRSGRFIHDFNNNMTGIIDVTGQRCFVMPINRKTVLPPKSLVDLIHKMWEGYYKVDTELVRESMRVVLPPITDTKVVGAYISNECRGMPIYKLEKYVGGVVKRSADLLSEAKFAQFAGKGITQFNIVNLEEVQAYERASRNH
ncbi:integral membrane protein 2A isoform X2 [Leptinotarsa decemlineata]|uniref:integral membrane protein 2A isoform X2 n=1 Tax=Leptinotarsa decemlineata TaxID=7539 RepID=UPI003D305CFA